MTAWRLVGVALSVACAACGYEAAHPIDTAPRDKLQWPFSSDSFWNRPLGSGAVTHAANLPAPTWVGMDWTHLVTAGPQDPVRDLFHPTADKCVGSFKSRSLPFPDDFVLPDRLNGRPGNGTSVLQPDGSTLVEIAGFSRCAAGGALFGFPYGDDDIYGSGLVGGQGGSGLSARGGAIRPGELTGKASFRHALKMVVPTRSLFFDAADPSRCYRWPARQCDAAANMVYMGADPALVQGSLLMLPFDVAEADLDLRTRPARRLFQVLRTFGAYVSGSAPGDVIMLGADFAVDEELRRAIGGSHTGDAHGDAKVWLEDLAALVARLHVVDNNTPETMGGGGALRAPRPPAIGN